MTKLLKKIFGKEVVTMEPSKPKTADSAIPMATFAGPATPVTVAIAPNIWIRPVKVSDTGPKALKE